MRKHIALGFSCQSRFTKDIISADNRTLPYDWNITTRDFILRSLTSLDGHEFTPPVDELELYVAPQEGTQGACGNGIWFWHDFPRNGNALVPDWQSMKNYAAKYPHLWQRFLSLIRDETTEKNIIISNSQSNLAEFADSRKDFAVKFGIDLSFLNDLREKLEIAGAVNFGFTVLCRHAEEFVELASGPCMDNLHPRFVGPLSLPTHVLVATSLLTADDNKPGLARLPGTYDNGARIVETGYESLLVYGANGQLVAVVSSYNEGYLFAFTGGVNRVMTAFADAGRIRFSNKTSWSRTS